MQWWNTWLSQRPYDLVVILVILLLLTSAYGRSGAKKTNKALLLANWLVVTLLTLSLMPIYMFLDPLLGGHNLVNLLQRIALSIAGLSVTISLTQSVGTVSTYKSDKRPLCSYWSWAWVCVAGLIASFFGMGAQHATSRGLVGYDNHLIAYPAYQTFSLLGLLIGIPYLVPRLLEIGKIAKKKRIRIQMRLFLISYLLTPMVVILYIVSPLGMVFIGLREVCIYTIFLTLTVAFMLAVRERKSLSATTDR